jgi:Fe2+ or Zn2+ uptake regulation protein
MQVVCKKCWDARMARPAHVRSAVATILEGSDRHGWSVDELAEDLGAAGIDASFSAVWRALRHLERAGVATRVDLGDGKVRYEPAVAHHDHVQCEHCGAIWAVDGSRWLSACSRGCSSLPQQTASCRRFPVLVTFSAHRLR